MRALVTGATGFIGRYLVQGLIASRHEVVALTRCQDFTFPHEVLVAQGDLISGQNIDEKLFDSIDVVFHCAGELTRTECMRQLHVDGTSRLLEIARRVSEFRGAPIHWVQLSSVGVYGPPQEAANAERVVAEDTPTRPLGEYEVTKTQSDELVIQVSERGLMTYSIVRPSNVFGANMPNQSLRQLGAMVRRNLFFYVGRPGAIATYVHVDDVVETLLRCGTDHRAKGKIFNISNDCLLEEMVEGVASALNVARPWLRLPEPAVRAATRVIGKVANLPLTQERISALVARTRYPYLKLERELGFIPRISVPSAIGEVVLTR